MKINFHVLHGLYAKEHCVENSLQNIFKPLRNRYIQCNVMGTMVPDCITQEIS